MSEVESIRKQRRWMNHFGTIPLDFADGLVCAAEVMPNTLFQSITANFAPKTSPYPIQRANIPCEEMNLTFWMKPS